jgi:hypothetical protein
MATVKVDSANFQSEVLDSTYRLSSISGRNGVGLAR